MDMKFVVGTNLLFAMSIQKVVNFWLLFLCMSRSLLVPSYQTFFLNRIIRSNNARTMSMQSSSATPIRDGFFNLPTFAVVGASTNRDKFGNKVLRCYKQHGKHAIPISKRETEIESIPCVSSLTALSTEIGVDMSRVGVSIITPPGATALILQEGVAVGCRHFYLQPGTADEDVRQLIASEEFKKAGVKAILGCVLVDLGFNDI